MNEIRPNKAGIFPYVLNDNGWIFRNVALGNMTQYKILVAQNYNGVIIGVEGRGLYEFGGFAHQGYVKEKLGLKHDSDAANVADFINDQLQNGSQRQGTYMDHLCTEVVA